MASGDRAVFEIVLTDDAVQSPATGQTSPAQPSSSQPVTPAAPGTPSTAQPSVGGVQPSALQQAAWHQEDVRLMSQLLDIARREESLSKQLLGKSFAGVSPTAETIKPAGDSTVVGPAFTP